MLIGILLCQGFAMGQEHDQKEVDSLLNVLNVAVAAQDSSSILFTTYKLASTYNEGESYDSASVYYNKGIRLAEALDEKASLASMQNNLGTIFLVWGNYQGALDLFLSSLATCKKIGDSAGISKSLNNIGIIYYDWGEKEISLKYYKRSFEIDSLLHDIEGQSKTLNNIAILYDEIGEKEKAINVYFQALELAQQQNDHYMIAVASSNIGSFYLENKDYEQAADYYFKTLEEYKLDRSVSGQAESYILIGDLYLESQEYEAALDYYKQGLDIVLSMNLSSPIMNVYEGMHKAYKEQGKYKTALDYFSKWTHLRDSIFSIENSIRLNTLTSAYEIQQKDKEMVLQQARMSEQKSRIKRQEYAMIGLIALILIIVVFTILLNRQYKLRVKAWQQLLSQHEEILKNRQELIIAKEKAEESDRLKTTFLVNVSHELRTPMNGIMGFTDLLQRGAGTEEQNKLYLSYIDSSSRQLLKVLNDIIDISSIETKQLKLDPEVCHPDNVFSDLLEYFEKEKMESNKGNITFKYLAPQNSKDHQFMADKKRLAQVVYNLLNNAMSFTREGSIEFGYEIVSPSTMRIFVKDTGIGIERSNFEMIFERFRQVDDSSTRQHAGSGLGLAICKELVGLMEGRIYLESKIDEGSTFFVEIPYVPLG